MLQINHYKKVCYLTDSEVNEITGFFKDVFGVDQIISIRLYLDENNARILEIKGFDEPISNTTEISVKNFKAFAAEHNKKYKEEG